MTIFRLSLTHSLFFRPWKGCLVQERPGVARLAHTNTASQTHTYETCPALRLSPLQHFYRDTLDLFPFEDRCLGLLGCLTTESASGAESLCIPLSFYWWRIVSFKEKKRYQAAILFQWTAVLQLRNPFYSSIVPTCVRVVKSSTFWPVVEHVIPFSKDWACF